MRHQIKGRAFRLVEGGECSTRSVPSLLAVLFLSRTTRRQDLSHARDPQCCFAGSSRKQDDENEQMQP